MTYADAYHALKVADDAWQAALEARFGKEACNVRYAPLGENATPEIARLYQARHAAFLAFERAPRP